MGTDIEQRELDKASLVRRIHSGDRAAEGELVAHYSRSVLYLLRRRVRDPETALDMHQETFVQLLRRLRQGDLLEPMALSGFVRQTALNIALQERRKSERRQTTTDLELIDRVADQSRSSLSILEHEEQIRIVHRVLQELSMPRDREILIRFYVSDESKETICAGLGLTAEHFDRVLHRARQRVRKLLSPTPMFMELSETN